MVHDEKLIKEIRDLTLAVKTQDNHVLSDLDTYRIERSLDNICGVLKQINESLEKLNESINKE